MRSTSQRKGKPLAWTSAWRLPKVVDTRYRSVRRAAGAFVNRLTTYRNLTTLILLLVIASVVSMLTIQISLLNKTGFRYEYDNTDSATNIVITNESLLAASNIPLRIDQIIDQKLPASIDDDDDEDQDSQILSVLLTVHLNTGKSAICRLLLSACNIKPCTNRSLPLTPSLTSLADSLSLRTHLIPTTFVTRLQIPLDPALGTRTVIRAIHRKLRVSLYHDPRDTYGRAIIIPNGRLASWLDLPTMHPHTWATFHPASRACAHTTMQYLNDTEMLQMCVRVRNTLLVLYVAGCESVQTSDAVVVEANNTSKTIAEPAKCWSGVSENNIVMADVWKRYVSAIDQAIRPSTGRSIPNRALYNTFVRQYRHDVHQTLQTLSVLAKGHLRWGISGRASSARHWLINNVIG